MRGDGACPVCLNRRRLGDVHPARTRYVLIEIDDISPNKLASIEEVEIQNAAWGGIDKS